MGQKGMDFKHKEVINIRNGQRLGFVQDVCEGMGKGLDLFKMFALI